MNRLQLVGCFDSWACVHLSCVHQRLLSFVCKSKTNWGCSSQTVSCAWQCMVIAIEHLCVSAHSHSVFLFLPVSEDWRNLSTSFQSSSLLTILGKVLAKLQKETDARCMHCLLRQTLFFYFVLVFPEKKKKNVCAQPCKFPYKSGQSLLKRKWNVFGLNRVYFSVGSKEKWYRTCLP